MRYILEASKEQMNIIQTALEEYFRLRMNQTWDFADSLCFEGFDFKNHTQEEFDEVINRRDCFKDEFEKLLNEAHPIQIRGGFRNRTTEMLRAQDVWQVIRHFMYLDGGGDPNGYVVDAREPLCVSGEPLPRMERKDSDD